MPDAETIVSTAKPGERVVGWQLSASSRASLLERFNPRYARTIADHVTIAAKVAAGTPLPDPVSAAVVGWTDDDKGVQALVVAIDGATNRPDGGTYHITWSLDRARTAKESNDVLRAKDWIALDKPLPIELTPKQIR